MLLDLYYCSPIILAIDENFYLAIFYIRCIVIHTVKYEGEVTPNEILCVPIVLTRKYFR